MSGSMQDWTLHAAARTTRAFYEINAEAYAASSVGTSMLRHGRRFAALLPMGGRVLDLGCGSGRDLGMLRGLGLDPVGMDYVEELARGATRRAGCRVIVADLKSLPFAAASFDGIWASASLLHLDRGEILDALHRCKSILRPGGALFVSVKAGEGAQREATGRSFTFYRKREWRQLLHAAGLSVTALTVEREERPVLRSDGRADAQTVEWLASLSLLG